MAAGWKAYIFALPAFACSVLALSYFALLPVPFVEQGEELAQSVNLILRERALLLGCIGALIIVRRIRQGRKWLRPV
jgi:hypothetical protein